MTIEEIILPIILILYITGVIMYANYKYKKV